jgi:hypothetical protein
MTCALSIALKRYFISVGDDRTSSLKIAMPVNIRWEPYATFDSVKLENKFAPVTVEIPLLSDPKRALPAVYSVTSNMKSKFAEIYATYVGIRMLGLVAPASLIAKLNDVASIAPTLAFSNMPGILTPINFGDQKCHKMVNSFNSAGRVALTVAFISYCGNIRSSITADTCVMDNP